MITMIMMLIVFLAGTIALYLHIVLESGVFSNVSAKIELPFNFPNLRSAVAGGVESIVREDDSQF